MKSFCFELKQFILLSFRLLITALSGGTECMVCGNFSFKMPLCGKCRDSVYDVRKVIYLKRCSVCGKVLVSEEDKCMECRDKSVFKNTDFVLPLYEYRLWNKELLFKWKIIGIRSLSPFLAQKIHDACLFHNFNIIVPVPPRKGKIARKGWDQIEEISIFLEKRYGLKVLRILKRVSGLEQKKLGRESRLENIGKSFILADSGILKKELEKTGGVIPEEVCVIDDILTTGSTVESCAEVLKEGGVKKVDVLALFAAS